MPLISIIVPAYNQQQYISETLDSVLAQTYSDWECIVMNDGSSDETLSIAESYAMKDARIRVFSQDNAGPSSARNNAVKHSNGSFILPLDADDVISPRYLELAMEHFSQYPETKLVYCMADYFGDITGPWDLRPYVYDEFIRINCIFNACFFRRSDYDKAGGYNESMREGLEDWDFLIGMLRKEDVVYQIPEVLFHYRRRNNSQTSLAMKHEPELFLQILSQHPDVYADLVFFELRECITDVDMRTERKIGHIFLKPRRIIRNLRSRFENKDKS